MTKDKYYLKLDHSRGFSGAFSVMIRRRFWFDRSVYKRSIYGYGLEGAMKSAKYHMDFLNKNEL